MNKSKKTFRSQIIWDFEFDENGITQNEYDCLDEDDLSTRTAEQMAQYAHDELVEALYNGAKYNDLLTMVDVVETTNQIDLSVDSGDGSIVRGYLAELLEADLPDADRRAIHNLYSQLAKQENN